MPSSPTRLASKLIMRNLASSAGSAYSNNSMCHNQVAWNAATTQGRPLSRMLARVRTSHGYTEYRELRLRLVLVLHVGLHARDDVGQFTRMQMSRSRLQNTICAVSNMQRGMKLDMKYHVNRGRSRGAWLSVPRRQPCACPWTRASAAQCSAAGRVRRAAPSQSRWWGTPWRTAPPRA